MKRALLQFAAALLVGSGASAEAAGPDPMVAFYGNTVTIDVPAGFYSARRFIDPDGTWREPRGSDFVRGVWRIEGGEVCSWQTDPPVHDPRHYCYPAVARQVGERWTTVDPDTGNTVYTAIEPGRN